MSVGDGGLVFVPRTREERLTGQKIVVVLEKACLELAKSRKGGRVELLNSLDHRSVVQRESSSLASREVEDLRPDIVHQCLLALLDSPLNRAGFLAVFIRTADNQLIEVSPQLRVPRTWTQFAALIITFLQKKTIRAEESSVVLLRFVKNQMDEILPVGTQRIGLSVNGRKECDFSGFCSKLAIAHRSKRPGQLSTPITFVVGAVAKTDPASTQNCSYVEEAIRISSFSLSAAACCSKICCEFENIWDVY